MGEKQKSTFTIKITAQLWAEKTSNESKDR
jgi:hypothetical protein